MDEDELNRIILEQKDIRKDKKIDIENKGKGYYTFIYNEQNPQLNYKNPIRTIIIQIKGIHLYLQSKSQ